MATRSRSSCKSRAAAAIFTVREYTSAPWQVVIDHVQMPAKHCTTRAKLPASRLGARGSTGGKRLTTLGYQPRQPPAAPAENAG
jgi:hypothetical protein